MPPERHLPSSGQVKVRQRSQRACGPCRKRKIKCDGKEPCEACACYGYECSYRELPLRGTQTRAGSVTTPPSKTTPDKNEFGPLEPAMLEPKTDGPYCATQTLVDDARGERLLHQSIRTRFTCVTSAIASPRVLGVTLGMPNPPRLQSFGWNPGRRPEPKVTPQNDICNIISLDEMQRYSTIYFNEIHPFFHMLDRQMFEMRAANFWTRECRGTDFEAVICGVVALGSFFAGSSPCEKEGEVVEQGRLLLELSTAHAPSLLSSKHVVAWVLRAIYLRSTTRPHISWMASCTAVHIAESIGLHRDITVTGCGVPELLEIEIRRKTFLVTMAINNFFAAEYGRTQVHIQPAESQTLPPKPEDLTTQTISILQAAPNPLTIDTPELVESLMAAASLPVNSPFLGLLRADTCFCIFRLLRFKRISLVAAQITSLLEVIRVALDGAKFLISMQHPWWNVVGTPFQSVCILLFLGTTESMSLLPKALETLKNVATTYDGALSREALNTAQSLVQQVRNKRNEELVDLDRGLDIIGGPSYPSGSQMMPGVPTYDWSIGNDLGFADILDIGGYINLEDDGFLQIR